MDPTKAVEAVSIDVYPVDKTRRKSAMIRVQITPVYEALQAGVSVLYRDLTPHDAAQLCALLIEELARMA